MNNRFLQLLVGVMTVCSFTLQPGFAQGTGAGQAKETAAAQNEGSKGQEAATAEKTRPGQEGIKVHGHWAIDVRNPDGTLVSHREFENALVGGAVGGGAYLSNILARNLSVGRWEISLGGGTTGPCQAGAASAWCFIAEGSGPFANANYAPGLAVSASVSGWFMLSGSVKAVNTASISWVNSLVVACAASIAPASPCTDANGGTFYGLTSASITPGINVIAGQDISVTVTISFS
jgi:hypothetical protein